MPFGRLLSTLGGHSPSPSGPIRYPYYTRSVSRSELLPLAAHHRHRRRQRPLHWYIYLVSIPVTGHTHHTFKCAITRALSIPRDKLRRPSPSVINVAALGAASVAIFAVYPPFVGQGP